ncbi:uncharacterized protein LOC130216587 [Danio aesculapii]|uniref:uncharacterized protein LOC130216587 n=1 Tax=Danio aesculapii TaxID=1142201 RepID=UPI0024C04065|nr:uncharacterized protein LOC130216587 [Danio aesculapii]
MKKLHKCVFGETEETEAVSVKTGESVTLHTSLSEIHQDDKVEWRFGAIFIAEINRQNKNITVDDVLKERFGNRLKLEHQTGDLTITNIKTTDSGLYEVAVSNTKTFKKTFNFNALPAAEIQPVSVIEGDSVTLHTDVPDIQIYDMIWWRLEHKNDSIVEINRTAGIFSTSDGADERFGHKLQVEYWTGSLTITNIETRHSGLYEVSIRNSRHTILKTYTVTVSGELEYVSVTAGESVIMKTGFTNIQIYDFIVWMFTDTVIAEIYKTAQQFNVREVADERFKGRLNLDHQSGSLTIINSKTADSGEYELKISSSRHSIHKKFTVTVNLFSAAAIAGISYGAVHAFGFVGAVVAACFFLIHQPKTKKLSVSVLVGDDANLNTDDTDVQRDDWLQWRFAMEKKRSTRIAEIFEGIGKTFYGDDGQFRDRLKLDLQTGSLSIMNTRITDAGVYKLRIEHLGKTSIKKFRVFVSCE